MEIYSRALPHHCWDICGQQCFQHRSGSPLSGSSCTRGSWLCSSVIFSPISFESIASRTSVKTSFTSSSEFAQAKMLVIETSSPPCLTKALLFHGGALRSQGLCMGSHPLSMWCWLRGTSRREDRLASIHPLAPSSEKTTMASISMGTWGQARQPSRGPWQDHPGFSRSPGGLHWRMRGWLEACGQRVTGAGAAAEGGEEAWEQDKAWCAGPMGSMISPR